MNDNKTGQNFSDISSRLGDVAHLLQQSKHIAPDTLKHLGDLIEELRSHIHIKGIPEEELSHLAQHTAHLAESLCHDKDTNFLGNIINQLEQAASRAQATAPATFELVRRLVESLSNIGI